MFGYSDNPNKDSLYVSSKEYQILNDKIIQIDKKNAEIIKECEKINGRIDDWYINFAITSGILLALVLIQFVNSRNIARNQASEELSQLENKIAEIEKKSTSLEARYKKHESYIASIEKQED